MEISPLPCGLFLEHTSGSLGVADHKTYSAYKCIVCLGGIVEIMFRKCFKARKDHIPESGKR